MRVQITGDRDWSDYLTIEKALRAVLDDDDPQTVIVVHGAARGADSIAGEVATELGCKVEVFPADWKKYGRAAGPIRNTEMLDSGPDVVLAFHDDLKSSKGTKNCVEQALKRNIPVLYFTTETFSEDVL